MDGVGNPQRYARIDAHIAELEQWLVTTTHPTDYQTIQAALDRLRHLRQPDALFLHAAHPRDHHQSLAWRRYKIRRAMRRAWRMALRCGCM